MLNPETTITRYPPGGLPLVRDTGGGDLVRDLDTERFLRIGGDMDTSDPRLLRGGDGESDFGSRDLPLPLSDIVDNYNSCRTDQKLGLNTLDGQSEKHRSSALCGTHPILGICSMGISCLLMNAMLKNTLRSISISSLHRTLSTNTPYLIPTFSC